MTRMLIFGSIAILGLASFAHSAGENVIVNLSNGDRLSGTLISETDGEVTIEHVVLGQIVLPREASKSKATQSSDAATPVLVSGVESASTSPWSGTAGVSINYTDNTSSSFNAQFSGAIQKKTEKEQFNFNGWYQLESASGEITQNKAFAELSQNWFVMDSPWLKFVDAQYQYNAFEVWEHQFSSNGGVGYKVYDTPDYGLTLKAGAGGRYLYTERELDAQLYFRADGSLNLSPQQKLSGFVQVTPELNDFGNTQGIVQLNYTIKMDVGVPLSTKVFLQNNFDTRPEVGSSVNDITVGIGVEYAF